MTPREAVARALARHVTENEDGFAAWVDTFIEDLAACGYDIKEREPTDAELIRAAVLDAAMDPLTFLQTHKEAPPDRANEPRLHIPVFNVTGEPRDVFWGIVIGGFVLVLLGALALVLHFLGMAP